jgi:hypothetical protein
LMHLLLDKRPRPARLPEFPVRAAGEDLPPYADLLRSPVGQ